MGSFGPLEIILIFLVVLLIFGAKRIPEIARGIGKGIREFKDATSEISQELESEAQSRQINRPQSPQHGQPQSRQPQSRQPQETSQQQSAQQEAPKQEAPGQESSPDPAGDESTNDTADTPDEKAEPSS
ncbi:MAG: twin-arginine translocase TatA/TatE family subunit [Salinibacter sp.]